MLNIKEFNKIAKKAEKLIEKYQKENDFFDSQIKLSRKLKKLKKYD